MLTATVVTDHNELVQINQLNQRNLKVNLTDEEQAQEGFVSWLYPVALLEKMHERSPSIIVKDNDRVVGYALATIKENTTFHTNLSDMMRTLDQVVYKGKRLFDHNCYFMGQICIEKQYRGKGIFDMLFKQHYKAYHPKYSMLITEIAASNPRSQRAHEKVGFKTVHNHVAEGEEWNVVVWDWEA